MVSHLSSGRINLNKLREAACQELVECLDKCPGTKAFVWDEQLIGLTDLIADFRFMKENDVVNMFTLSPGKLRPHTVDNVIFMVRPKLSLMDIVADVVFRENEVKGSRQEFHIFFVPSRSLLCEKKLKDLGVYGDFATIEEFGLHIVPVDRDVMSMEMDHIFKECTLNNDMTGLHHAAKALIVIQTLFGIIPNIYGKGNFAKHVFDLMIRMRKELSGKEPQIAPQIDNLLLIDRSVDLISPIVTQLTFDGLLDEFYGINNNIIKLPAAKFAKQNENADPLPNENKSIVLNSSKEMYAELRDKNFSAVGAFLNKKTKILSAQCNERHEQMTIGEMKQFVSNLPTIQETKKTISLLSSITELINEQTSREEFIELVHMEQDFLNGIETDKNSPYIEDCISKQEPLIKVLRLICLQSITNSGLKQKVLDFYKREIIQTYGYEHCLTLKNLENSGLLKVKNTKIFSVLRKTLNLTVENVDEKEPTDIAYVHSLYAPISVRLAQFLAHPGWRAITDALNLLPGPTFEEIQNLPAGLRKKRNSGSSVQSNADEPKVTLVFFLGGCTFAEVAALRFLSQQDDSPMEYIIATTKLINGKTFIKSLTEHLR